MKGKEVIYTIPLGDVYEKPRKKRAPRAIKEIKNFVKKHAKLEDIKLVKISSLVNSLVWARSIEKPPRKIKVKLVRDEPYVYVLGVEQRLEDVKKKPKEEKKTDEKNIKKKSDETSEKKEDKKIKKSENKKEETGEKPEGNKEKQKDKTKNENEKQNVKEEVKKNNENKKE